MLSIPHKLLTLGAVSIIGFIAGAGAQEVDPATVVVVANKSVKGSVKVAKAYQALRNIPENNLILIRTEETERITREAYIETIHNPLLEELLDRGLLDALPGKKDEFGRKTVSVLKNPLRYMVLCYGVPSHILKKPVEELDDLNLRRSALTGVYLSLVDQFSEGLMARNEASVDGELALLLKRDMPMNGFVPNPLFNRPPNGPTQDIIRVTRLDGPSEKAVLRMLDNSRRGEALGLKGRAYVDEDGRKGPYEEGNTWMANTALVFKTLGFDLDHDTARKTFPAEARFDAPVLYAGWYAGNITGPFTLPGFTFPPGAVAAHLHSFSAKSIRSPNRGWVGPMVERGVSATFGNVAEPYLKFTHRFDLFFAALGNGWTLADAAYFALPALSWQAVTIGDPLYRPFAVSLDTQLENTGDATQILSDQYVVLRKMNRLLEAGETKEAVRTAGRGMQKTPGAALGLGRARLLEEQGKTDAALRALSFLAQLDPMDSMEWGLYAELGETLNRLGDTKNAFRIFEKLEAIKMPEKVKLAFLRRGIPIAEDAGRADISVDWRVRVTPPPPPPPPPESE
ncbi:TIGR03790 family protein [Puniceicoccales bacterium CK1056]|uniref:TIGR03790 family protein n=1 Tax=Oceanipulchritudo coccoides TaxID=2706888 RepID=A0A6B2M247_9BACT|nr:TIGR03790 family protein [Oceanipulchritudo coccoides]NDV62214.1 TIGR03790 family protein [Oceanipulchritudo coccoides]